MRPATLTALALVATLALTDCGATSEPAIRAPVESSEPAELPAGLTVLRVVATGCDQPHHGTAFVVRTTGTPLVVTAAHVVAGANDVTLLDARDQTLAATDPASVGGLAQPSTLRLIAFDPARDVAVFATPGPAATSPAAEGLSSGAPPASLATSTSLDGSGTATVFGYPRQQPIAAVAASFVSAETTSVADIYNSPTAPLRMLALAVDPAGDPAAQLGSGFSGAPVVGSDGTVWGVVVAVGRPSGAQLVIAALSADELNAVARQAEGQASQQVSVDAGPCVVAEAARPR